MYKSVDTHKHARTYARNSVHWHGRMQNIHNGLIPLMLFKIIPRMFTEYRANILANFLSLPSFLFLDSKFIIDAIS